MTDPTERPEVAPISEATGRAVAADRARVEAAHLAARRSASSLAGRADRIARWLRNRRTGPLARARRAGGVVLRAIRRDVPLADLPEALATALLAPVRRVGEAPDPRPPADHAAERAAAARRLATFSSRRDLGRPRVAVVADDRELEAYRRDWDVVAIRPEDWVVTLAAEPPDLVVIDAARAGNGGAWTYRIAWTAHPDGLLQRDLRAVAGWAAGAGIPTIFRATAAGPASLRDWAAAARLLDLVVAPDEVTAAAFEADPDRRGAGAVAIEGWLGGSEGSAVVAAVRAAGAPG